MPLWNSVFLLLLFSAVSHCLSLWCLLPLYISRIWVYNESPVPSFHFTPHQRAMNREQGGYSWKFAFKYARYAHSFSSKPPGCPQTTHHWPPTVLWSPITYPVLFSAFSVSLVCSLPAGPRPDPLISLSVTKNLWGQASYHGHSNHQYGFETFQDPPLAPVNCVCELLMCC